MIVSIIIPSYNREKYISETLASVLGQSFTEWECIIIDDGSTDNTEKVVKNYVDTDNRFSFYSRPTHMLKGANSCRNFGFIKSKGKYIKFLDSDDLLTSDCLQKQITILESNSGLKVCLSYGRYFNNETKKLEELWSKNKEHSNYLLGHITNEIRWAVSDTLWRKSFFKKPPFKEGLMNSQEWLMHGEAFLKLNVAEIYNLDETFTLIRRGNLRMSSSQSSRYYKNQKLARIYLLGQLIRSQNFNIKYYYQLFKQVLVYQYWQFKKL